MAVRWRCPRCGADAIGADPFALDTMRCDGCAAEIERTEMLCILCDAPDPLRPRGTIHVECRACGERQMIFAAVV